MAQATADILRRILYPSFVATIIATVWALGHAQALADQADKRRYWPPVTPEMFHVDDDPVNNPGPEVSLDDF